MTVETFFEKFDLFADAPGAVEKMRKLVLGLAVQGKLVEQEDSDGIANVKSPVDGRYSVPESWRWISFADVGDQRLGKMLDARKNRGEAKPYLRNTNVQWMRFVLDDVKEMRLETDELEEFRLRQGDLLICEGGEPGRCAIWRADVPEMYFQKAIHRVRPRADILPEYLAFNLRVDTKNGVLDRYFTGATIKHLTGRSLRDYSIPLPPLAEQKRIVAKVDELMGLCDWLEAQQQEREQRHAALSRAALARFAQAPTPANLEYLFHNAYTIDPADLRKSILTLAVQGKLVEQEESDETTGHFLQRAGLKSTAEPNEFEWELPSKWALVRYEDVAIVASGVTLGRKLTGETVSLPYLRVANVQRGGFDLSVVKEISIAPSEYDRFALKYDDLLMVEGGDWDKVGRAAVWKGQIDKCLHQNHIFRSRMRCSELLPEWFERFFNSPFGRQYFESASKQTTNLASINMRQVRGCPVPLPPPAEQKRIVAKMEALMALVDRLEAQQAQARDLATRLLDAAVAELTQTASAQG